MLTLYTMTGCAYCTMVLHKLEELNLPFEEKNVDEPEVAGDLIERGGKRQVPYLVDTDRTIEMYESEDICAYLEETYGTDGKE